MQSTNLSSPSSSPVALRPLGIGELIDGVFRLYRANFFALIGITAITQVPMSVLTVIAQDYAFTHYRGNQFASYAVSVIVAIVQTLTLGALTLVAIRTYLGQPLSFGQAYRLSWRRYGSLLLAVFLEAMATGGPLIAIALLIYAMPYTLVACLGVLLLPWIPIAIYLGTRWSVAIPAILAEEIGGVGGLSRSWHLTGKYFWRALGVLAVNGILIYILAGLPGSLVVLGGGMIFEAPLRLVQALAQAINALGLTLTLPINAIVTVLLYYDLRVRKEGYDLQLLAEQSAAQQAGGTGEASLPPAEN